jgi:hypothetical protein
MEAAHEIGEIAETDIVGDIGNRAPIFGQQMRAACRSRERTRY